MELDGCSTSLCSVPYCNSSRVDIGCGDQCCFTSGLNLACDKKQQQEAGLCSCSCLLTLMQTQMVQQFG